MISLFTTRISTYATSKDWFTNVLVTYEPTTINYMKSVHFSVCSVHRVPNRLPRCLGCRAMMSKWVVDGWMDLRDLGGRVFRLEHTVRFFREWFEGKMMKHVQETSGNPHLPIFYTLLFDGSTVYPLVNPWLSESKETQWTTKWVPVLAFPMGGHNWNPVDAGPAVRTDILWALARGCPGGMESSERSGSFAQWIGRIGCRFHHGSETCSLPSNIGGSCKNCPIIQFFAKLPRLTNCDFQSWVAMQIMSLPVPWSIPIATGKQVSI